MVEQKLLGKLDEFCGVQTSIRWFYIVAGGFYLCLTSAPVTRLINRMKAGFTDNTKSSGGQYIEFTDKNYNKDY